MNRSNSHFRWEPSPLSTCCTSMGLAAIVAFSGCSGSGTSADNPDAGDANVGTPLSSGASGAYQVTSGRVGTQTGTTGTQGGKSGGTSGTGASGAGASGAGTSGAGSSGAGSSGVATSGGTSGGAASGVSSTGGTKTAAELARKLGRSAEFLIGMGNDLDSGYDWEKNGAHILGPKLDIHYAYLTGLQGEGGWPDWNEGGYFPQLIAKVDVAHGVIPMFSVWSMPARGENNLGNMNDNSFMRPYWAQAVVLFQRLAELDAPAIVHVEPDYFAYAERANPDPTKLPAVLHADCEGLPRDMTGFSRCWTRLARKYAPKVAIGFHASQWAADDAADAGRYLKACGADETDMVVIDTLDRDAGCFEAGASNCTRQGDFYWDESNKSSPNFREHLDFAKTVHEITGKPMLWWQTPFGVPSETRGGRPGHYRDNRVHYFFAHIDELVDAGGVGATFGVGSGEQTYVDSDGDQFKNAVTAYNAKRFALP